MRFDGLDPTRRLRGFYNALEEENRQLKVRIEALECGLDTLASRLGERDERIAALEREQERARERVYNLMRFCRNGFGGLLEYINNLAANIQATLQQIWKTRITLRIDHSAV